MPTSSKEMTGPDLSAVLEGLTKADVNFILVGGLAAVVQGAPVPTMDVDIGIFRDRFCSSKEKTCSRQMRKPS